MQPMVTLFHRTTPDAAEGILRAGFIETTYRTDAPDGVHLCNRRGDEHSVGNPVRLAVELPEDEVTPDRQTRFSTRPASTTSSPPWW